MSPIVNTARVLLNILLYTQQQKRTEAVCYAGWLVWRSGNGVRHINEVKLRRARLVLGLVTTFGGCQPSQYLSRPLSQAIPPWVGAMTIPEIVSAISG